MARPPEWWNTQRPLTPSIWTSREGLAVSLPNNDAAIPDNLLQNFVTARMAVGWSRAQLAERLQSAGLTNWHATTIARVERGERPVRVTEVETVANVFGVTPSLLLGPPETFNGRADFMRARAALLDARENLRAAEAEYQRASSHHPALRLERRPPDLGQSL